MKAIIDGKRYDTDAPKTVEVAENSAGAGGDFSAFEETLYRTGKGSWFLAGCGGPMTRYGHGDGYGSTVGGNAIIPLSEDEALEWLERNDETDAIEKYFSTKVVDA